MILCNDGVYVASQFVAKLRPRDFGKTDLIGADGKVLGGVEKCTRDVAALMDGDQLRKLLGVC